MDNKIGDFTLQYQGGEPTQRIAKIITEPNNSTNHVLCFELNEANLDNQKGRIQANLYNIKKGLKEFGQSIRIFLPEDFETLKKFPGEITFLTIAEFWNNITWSQNVPYGFRISLAISKPLEGECDLYFSLNGQDCKLFENGSQEYTTLWSKKNQNITVPIGEWFTLEYYYKEGGKLDGRFYMTIQLKDGEKEVVFDVTDYTHNSNDPNPDGVTDFSPMKLYTSKTLIDYMRSQSKVLRIFWDDFRLFEY